MPAASGSRATAIRAPATCCTTIVSAYCVTSGSSTTSRARCAVFARPGCPRFWPAVSSGGSDVDTTRPARVSTLDHWESYWKGHADLDHTYSTGGRLAREVLADGEVKGRRVLEVGAGSGRDTLALARGGAVAVVLD